MNKKIYCLLLLIFYPFLLAAEVPFVLITVPKSGSHLAIKALHFLTGTPPIWHTHFPSFWCIPPEKGFLYTHFCVPPELEKNYQSLSELKRIVMIRDLRDVAVSIVGQIKKAPWPGLSGEERNSFLKLSFDEQLLFVINFEYDIYEVAERAPHSNQVSLVRLAEQAVRYSLDPDNLLLRYEELVGEQGGGTAEQQLNAIRSIAAFIQVEATEEKLATIAEQLYGNECDPFGNGGLQNYHSTFSQGQIGAWKKAFKEVHIKAFKHKLGNSLIELGYEQDYSW